MTTWLKRHSRLALMLTFGLAILPGYLRAYKVSGASEAPSMNLGDSFLVNKAAYTLRLPYSHVTLLRMGSPKRGDMVLLLMPEKQISIIKRAIGLPGETIEFLENRILIDGRMLPLEELNRADFKWVAPANHIGSDVYNEDGHFISFTPGQGADRNHASVSLKEREYFLVGDNRDDSLDSRTWGPVSEDLILGKVLMTYARSK